VIKRRNYTFALVTENTPNINEIIELVTQYPKYAYILHDKDVKDDGTGELKPAHYHFYIEFPSPRSLRAVSKELNIIESMLRQVYDKRGILNYLTHKKQPEKFQYNDSEIMTNMDFASEIAESVVIKTLYNDLKFVKMGLLAADRFIETYQVYIASMSFYNQVRLLDFLSDKDKVFQSWKYEVIGDK
jgi:hypothetical protein